VQVEPGWIDALAAPFADPRVGGVGGRIIPTFSSGRPEWLTDEEIFLPIVLPDYGLEPFVFDDGRLPIGANMAMRASLLNPDPFDASLGHSGRISLGFEEFAVLRQVGVLHTLAYAPDAVVRHMLGPDRLTVCVSRRLIFQHGVGLARFQRACGVEGPSLARRAVRAHRAWRTVRSSPPDVGSQLRALRQAGIDTEKLLAPLPWLANWCVRHLVA
jgi:hypothetical protein